MTESNQKYFEIIYYKRIKDVNVFNKQLQITITVAVSKTILHKVHME